jgi:hypothetical protein
MALALCSVKGWHSWLIPYVAPYGQAKNGFAFPATHKLYVAAMLACHAPGQC